MNHVDCSGREADEHLNKIDNKQEEPIRCFGCVKAYPIDDLIKIGIELYCETCINY